MTFKSLSLLDSA